MSIFSSGGVHLLTWARELQLAFPANRKELRSSEAEAQEKSVRQSRAWNLGEVSEALLRQF